MTATKTISKLSVTKPNHAPPHAEEEELAAGLARGADAACDSAAKEKERPQSAKAHKRQALNVRRLGKVEDSRVNFWISVNAPMVK
jgi:hypothetical protein